MLVKDQPQPSESQTNGLSPAEGAQEEEDDGSEDKRGKRTPFLDNNHTSFGKIHCNTNFHLCYSHS